MRGENRFQRDRRKFLFAQFPEKLIQALIRKTAQDDHRFRKSVPFIDVIKLLKSGKTCQNAQRLSILLRGDDTDPHLHFKKDWLQSGSKGCLSDII